MSNLPVRSLGGVGIVSDLHPYDLPPNALSAGVNVRFENSKISRGPIWLDIIDYDTQPLFDLISNGTFDTDTTGWTAGQNGTLSVDAGKLRVTNGAAMGGYAYQRITCIPGQPYTVTFDSFNGTANPAVNISSSPGGNEYGHIATAGIGQSVTFTPTQATIYIICQCSSPTIGQYAEWDNIRVTRQPAFQPGFCFAIPPVLEGDDEIVAVAHDGSQIVSLMGNSPTDVTPASPTIAVSDNPWTNTFLGSVAYLNRYDGVPLQKTVSDSQFAPLTAWDPSWRCGALRSYKDFLVALNVSQGGTEYPTMVKWSDIAAFGNPPATWDITDTTASAGENIINEMVSPIVDGLTLRDYFIIYCQNEVWLMSYIGGNFLFQFRKLYDRCGVINQNCVVQVDGLHYVFDRQDIYVHDGSTKKSIVHGKNKDYIFNALPKDKAHLCFVAHHPQLNEIHFCYPSEDRLVAFQNPTLGCNRIAAYNYQNDTWSFYDAPNVTAWCLSNIPSGDSYEDAGSGAATYDTYAGSYKGEGDDANQHSIFSSRSDSTLGLTASRLLGLDLVIGGTLPKPLCAEANKDSFLERVGLDLDEEDIPLRMYKVIHTIFPQIGVIGDQVVQFQFGANDIVDTSPKWGAWQDYDPRTTSKVDTGRIAGRYLAFRLRYSGTGDFSFSGLDADVKARGRRG